MSKKIVVLMCSLVILVGSVFSTSFVSNASSLEVNVDYSSPAMSESQGYVNFLFHNNTDSFYVKTIFWSCYATKNGVQSPADMHISVTNNNVEFVPYVLGADSCWYNLCVIDSRNNYYTELISSATERFNYYSNDSFRGYTIHGNGYINSFSNAQTPFVVNFSSGKNEILLQDIIDELVASNNYGSLIYQNVFNILNSVDGVETQLTSIASYLRQIGIDLQSTNSRLDILLSQVNKSNTWLEKIFDYLQESQEQQKQEAQTQGNNSTSQGMNAIEDKGAGFSSSLGGLTNSMSYTGTQCAWEFPEVKLPAISGVMDEMVLIKKQPIDFAVWVNVIPSDILLVVQSLCTVGLIIYCFKELYSTIAYVLTLRKDDNS